MADIVDRAQAREEELRQEALDRVLRQARSAAVPRDCVDCGGRIPAARRRAVPGCERCVHCQVDYERRARLQERT